MSRKRTSRNPQNKTARRERNPIPWKYCLLTLVCGLFLVAGFFFAAQQHFSSIDFSIKNSRLKKQIEELEADKRRLMLAKEIALSPAEIKRAAKKIGLTEMTASNIAVLPASFVSQEKPRAEKPDAARPKQEVANKSENAKQDEKKPAKEIKAEKKAAEIKEEPERTKIQIAKK